MRRFLRPVFILISMLLSTLVDAKMYKWTDESGQVHYGDSVPAQYLKNEHKVMNERGLAIKQIDAAETEEQRIEKERLALEEKRQAELEVEQRQRDRVLLDTYTTERDLTAARDARFEAVASQIQLSGSIMDDSRKKLATSQKLIESISSKGRDVPDTLTAKVEREQRQLEMQEEVMRSHLDKRKAIEEQFGGYIERFRELKAEKQLRRERYEARHPDLTTQE